MDSVRIREEDVQRLLQGGQLSVVGRHVWRTGAMKTWAKATIPVTAPGPKPPYLRIVASINLLEKDRRNFALLWNNTRIRALDLNGSHENHHTNEERWVQRTHKHRWTDHCHDRFAYTPEDITATDLEGQLAQFCAECGINFTGTLGALPDVHGGIYDDL